MSHVSVHVDAVLPVAPLFCHHPDGRVSVTIADDDDIVVWLTGTSAELQEFAADLAATTHLDNPKMLAPAPVEVAS